MINLKEKKLLVKMNAALGRPSDPSLLEEIEQEEARLKEEQEKHNALMEKQSKNISAAFADLTRDISNLVNEQKKKTKEEEVILERFSNILTQISQHKPSDIRPIVEDTVPAVKEEVEVVVEQTVSEIIVSEPAKPKSLVDAVVEKVSSTTTPSVFVQPDPPLVERDIQAIQQKLKMLEGWLSKVSMAGPGGGAVWLHDLDDVSHASVRSAVDGQVLTYDGVTNKWVAVTPSAVAAGNTTLVQAYVTNADQVTIHKGDPVFLYRATGNRPSVIQAQNTGDAYSAKTMGLAAEDIPAGNPGWVITRGTLTGVDTSMYSEGDTLYLGNTAGTLTNVKPYAPNHLVYIGVVQRANQGQGQIYVQPQNGYELDEIHDVNINHNVVLANGHTIVWNSSNSLWENRSLSGLVATFAANSAAYLNGVAANQYAYANSIPVVPTNVSAFTNDSGYLTSLSANNLTGTTLKANVVSSSLTTVGTLTGLTVNGAVRVTYNGNGSTYNDIANALNVTGAVGIGGNLYVHSNFLVDGDIYMGSVGGALLTSTTLNPSVINSGLTTVGTLTSLTSNGTITSNAAIAFVAGIAANSGVALQMPHEGALRNMSNTSNYMYFDVSNGGTAHGGFRFRSSNGFTELLDVSTNGLRATSAFKAKQFNGALDSEVSSDNLKFRVSNQGGVFPQIGSTTGSNVDVSWTIEGYVAGGGTLGGQNQGVNVNAYTSLYSAHGLDTRGDMVVATVVDKVAGKIYRVTFIVSNNSSNVTGYSIVIERIV